MILYLHTTFNTILIRLCVLNKNGLVQSILIQLTKRFMEKKKSKNSESVSHSVMSDSLRPYGL